MPFLDTSRFTPDREPVIFEAEEVSEKKEIEYFVIVPSQHKCLTSKRGLGQVESWLREMTGKADVVEACEQLGAVIVSEVQ